MGFMTQITEDLSKNSSRIGLSSVSAGAALTVGLLFLIAAIDLIISGLQHGSINRWLSPFQNNWLVVIFKLHAGYSGVQMDLLNVLNLLDIAILALVGTTCLGLYAVLKQTSKIWTLIALVQPFLGIMLFITTKSAGRSAVMGAALVISIVMLRNNSFNKATAYMGILASALLLFGDFSAGIIPPSNMIASLFGIGYLLFVTWFFLIARRLFQPGVLGIKTP
jgi:hypothetical protein